jgi:hypothetical protein
VVCAQYWNSFISQSSLSGTLFLDTCNYTMNSCPLEQYLNESLRISDEECSVNGNARFITSEYIEKAGANAPPPAKHVLTLQKPPLHVLKSPSKSKRVMSSSRRLVSRGDGTYVIKECLPAPLIRSPAAVNLLDRSSYPAPLSTSVPANTIHKTKQSNRWSIVMARPRTDLVGVGSSWPRMEQNGDSALLCPVHCRPRKKEKRGRDGMLK